MPSHHGAGHSSLRFDVLSALACSRLAKDGVARALEIIAHAQSWDLGVAWLSEDDHLRHVADCRPQRAGGENTQLPIFVDSIRRRLRPISALAEPDQRQAVSSCSRSKCHHDWKWKEEVDRAGLQTAFSIPLCRGGVVYGAFEFFSNEARELDASEEQTLNTIAGDLGKFLC